MGDGVTDLVTTYAERVVDGTVPAGRYHRLSCARHLRDMARAETVDFPFRFEIDRARRFLRFSTKVRHYKGEWSGQFVQLSESQVFRLGSIFGWIHAETGLRRFRTAYNELPRKSGKSLEAAIVVDYTTFFDGEPGAEGYCAATKREQALIVFRDAKKLVTSSGLKDRIKVQVSNLYSDATESKVEPLSADYNSMDGLNPHCVIVDELHAHKDRGVLDVLETAMGARRQPLMFQITTAGDDPISVCGDQHDYSVKILDGTFQDETFFCFIASADPGDDWQDEKTWIKANPHWNISVKPDDMRALALKAKGIPSAAAAFRQKRLNEWVNATAPCLSVEGWRQGQTAWSLDEMTDEPCYLGVDLASSIDLCALSIVFPPTETRPTWRLAQRLWTPRDTLADRAHRDRAPYGLWVEQGWLTAVDGTTLDHDIVRQAILGVRGRFDIQRIGFDPWHADAPVKNLVALDGFAPEQALAVPQTYAGMSSACLRMQAEILSGHVDARGCPVTAWAVSNVVANHDGKDNLMFAKGKSRGRIDPVIAATIGMSLALRMPPARKRKHRGAMIYTHAGWVPALPPSREAQP